MRRSIAAVLAVGAVLVLADFGTAAAAEYGISRQMRDRLQLPEDPSVRVQGFSFIAQAVTGRYDQVDVSMQRVPIGSMRTPVIGVRMYGVRAPIADLVGSDARFRAAAARSSVQIGPLDVRRMVVARGGPAATVERLTVEQVEPDTIDEAVVAGGDPTLRGLDPRTAALFAAEMPVDGAETRVAVLSALVVSDGALRIVPRDVREYGTGEPVPATVREALTDALAIDLDPGPLPLGVPATTASVPGPDVLEISGSVRDLAVGDGEPSSGSTS
ncbi:hypothetical protein AFB00_09005 [Pseudonocardia sp. HH130630-07]|nr:hypothetical protein AFB00_09005 [Pseudonocardia sp. HH130630-07]